MLAAAAAAGALTLSQSANAAEAPMWAYSDLLEAVDGNRVEKATFSQDGKRVLSVDTDGQLHDTEILPTAANTLLAKLNAKGVRYTVQAPAQDSGNMALGVLSNLLPPVLLLGGLFLLNRRGAGGGGPGGGMNPMNMGQSQSKIQMEPNTGVDFQDVAGCDGAKLELMEVVEFLKNPSKFSALGAKIPRGVVMEGPPGTGKTLLARAVAGEAGVPFISASGSEFVEMFVGVGASRVRSLFAEAKKNAPCIIFIDEIDAVGRQRAGGGGGGMPTNDEREQTLNQILTEMDGFDGNSGVIVIAATNRADVLDNALTRPGRFDRRVPVDLPDKEGRFEILKVHCKGKPLAEDLDLDMVARRAIGFSGASLANLMNEAAIVAARRDKTEITYDEIDYALDRLTVGMQKQTGVTIQTRQELVAYHEAGHAIMGALIPDHDTVAKVTIIPRSNGAGGFTLFVPSEERMASGMYSKRYLQGQLAVALGGRVAEELKYGEDEITTGASNDLQQVMSIARRMITQWGFSKNLPPVAWEGQEQASPFAGPSMGGETNKQIDEEVRGLVNEAYKMCKKTLVDNRALLDEMADALCDKETIGAEEIQSMVWKSGAKVASIAN